MWESVKMDKVFRALSDPTRREILRLLRSGDMSAGQIAENVSVSKSTLSGHLNVLKEARLIVAERYGTTIVYSLNVAVYEEMVAAVMGLLGVGAEEGTGPRRKKRGVEGAYQHTD